jgi:RND family efflux transporter MFP subunit
MDSGLHENMTETSGNTGLKVIIILLIILSSIAIAFFFSKTQPKAKKTKPPRLPVVVDITRAVTGSHQIVISAMGTVIAEKEVELKSPLTGEIIEVSPEFIPGGLFAKGDTILRIDPADYQLNVKRTESLLKSAEAALAIEMGHQSVAKKEFDIINQTSVNKINNSDLALRKPYLDKAKAQLEIARTEYDQAVLNYTRTIIQAPFNAVVINRSVNKGSNVSSQSVIGTFAGTDAWWVEISVPVEQLKWLTIPSQKVKNGSRVDIFTKNGTVWHGEIIRLTGSLSNQSRMAKLIARIDFPLQTNQDIPDATPLLLGSYVSVSIHGHTVDNVTAISRALVRDNDTIWVYDEGVLSIRHPRIIWKDRKIILAETDIKDGEAIVISNLFAPVDGMKLRLPESDSEKAAEEKKGQQKNPSRETH